MISRSWYYSSSVRHTLWCLGMNRESETAMHVLSVFNRPILHLTQVKSWIRHDCISSKIFDNIFFTDGDKDNEGQETDVWEFRDAVFPTVLMDGLNYLRTTGLLCDVILITGKDEHPAQRVVLAAVSPYFR